MKKALLLALVWPIAMNAQSISGKVTLGNSGLPVKGARLVLLDSLGSPRMGALSDSSGIYRMGVGKPGSYQFRASGPTGSNQTVTSFFVVADARPTLFDVALIPETTHLATVNVRGKQDIPVASVDPQKFDEFIRRRDLGAGHFMVRHDIEVKNARVTRDLLAAIPGLTVRQDGDSSVIQSTRCSGKSIPGLDTGTLVGGVSKSDNKLLPMLFIDGHRMSDLHAMDDIRPGEIEAIEVYQGASELPAEAKGDSCFAIYIWLKAGG